MQHLVSSLSVSGRPVHRLRENAVLSQPESDDNCCCINTILLPDDEHTGLFISPSGISELDCATTKTDTAERSISIGRESLQVFFVLGALAYFQVPPLGGSRDEKWRSQ